jgi:hypothetical protein
MNNTMYQNGQKYIKMRYYTLSGLLQPFVFLSVRSLGVKAADAQGWQPYYLHVPIVLKFWKPKPAGPLRVCSGLYRDSFTYLGLIQNPRLYVVHVHRTGWFNTKML